MHRILDDLPSQSETHAVGVRVIVRHPHESLTLADVRRANAAHRRIEDEVVLSSSTHQCLCRPSLADEHRVQRVPRTALAQPVVGRVVDWRASEGARHVAAHEARSLPPHLPSRVVERKCTVAQHAVEVWYALVVCSVCGGRCERRRGQDEASATLRRGARSVDHLLVRHHALHQTGRLQEVRRAHGHILQGKLALRPQRFALAHGARDRHPVVVCLRAVGIRAKTRHVLQGGEGLAWRGREDEVEARPATETTEAALIERVPVVVELEERVQPPLLGDALASLTDG
mmetsp:Transcript_10253/g.26656  ORF Transcript_10253/g.26656 Transcript_10253/m.26656 type:complete len:287 (+) Transcript_10253:203-1063(+)